MTEPSSYPQVQPPGRHYSRQFKSDAIQACLAPDAVIAHVARRLGINARMLSRWVNQHRRHLTQDDPAFVAWSPSDLSQVTRQTLSSPPASSGDPIRVSCSRGTQQVTIEWPVGNARQCAEFLREWLR